MSEALKTDARLVKRLKEAARTPMSADELNEQRISFIVGNMPAKVDVTRDGVRQALKKREGTRVG